MKPLDKDWYTVEETAELFEVSKQTIYQWMNDRGLAWLQVGGRRKITAQAIRDFIREGNQPAPYSDTRTTMPAAA